MLNKVLALLLTAHVSLLIASCDTDGPFPFAKSTNNSVKNTDAQEPWLISGSTMGTRYNIKLFPSPPPSINKQKLTEMINASLNSVDQMMSTYKADSELSRLNRASINTCIPVSKPLYDVIALSKQIGEESERFFDITVGPAVDAWGFGPVEVTDLPTEEAITELKQRIGDQAIALNSTSVDNIESFCIEKTAPRYIDLSAIAKGYAVDQLAQLLRANEINNFLVEVGGEVWAEGSKPGNQPWLIAVEAPLKQVQRKVQRALRLKDIAVASSGDYRNFYERDGKAFSHTINPNTAKPVEHSLVSVTVLADSTAKADAWATALLAMGTDKALRLAEQYQLAVLLIERLPTGQHSSQHTEQHLNQPTINQLSNQQSGQQSDQLKEYMTPSMEAVLFSLEENK